MKEGIEDTIKGIRILRGHIDNAPYNKKFSLMTSELYKFQIDMEKKLHKFIPQISKLSKDKMLESVNEAVEPKGNMAKIAKVVKDKQATKLSGVMIDMQSANLLMKLWDAVSDKDKEKMNKMNARLLTTVIKKLWSRINLKLPI